MTAIGKILEASKKVKGRKISQVFYSLTEEVGELATELAIEEGHSTKNAGPDGVKGEAVDVILCAVDILHIAGVTEEEINLLIHSKTEKWLKSK
jgi:NTP pyrophosphatase (non-canonical NTP hydrolase)